MYIECTNLIWWKKIKKCLYVKEYKCSSLNFYQFKKDKKLKEKFLTKKTLKKDKTY